MTARADEVLAEHFRFERLRLEPGDIAVFTTDMMMTRQQADEVRARAQEIVGPQNKVLLLTCGLQVWRLADGQIEVSHRRPD